MWAIPVAAWACIAGRAAAGDSMVYLVTLDKAIGGKAMTLYLDVADGKVRRAFATARTFNGAPHDVDASGLTQASGTSSGELERLPKATALRSIYANLQNGEKGGGDRLLLALTAMSAATDLPPAGLAALEVHHPGRSLGQVDLQCFGASEVV